VRVEGHVEWMCGSKECAIWQDFLYAGGGVEDVQV
jgi:hypothetical protein